MKILFTILIVIAVLIVILLITAAFGKDEFVIEREVIVNKPKAEVYNYIKFLKNGEKYNKWVMQDPLMKKDIRGTDGTVGFVYAWDSNARGGKGEQEITQLIENEKIDYMIRFEKPFQNVSTSSFILTSVSPDQTKVVWLFKGSKNYPMKILHLVLNLEKALGNDMQQSLNNIKTNLQQ